MTKLKDLTDQISVSGYFNGKQAELVINYVKLAYELGKVETKELMVKELKDIFKI